MSNPHPTKTGAQANPNGRPKTKPIADALRHLMTSGKAKKVNQTEVLKITLPPEPTVLEYLASSIINNAMNGDTAAFKEVADRTEGKIPQPLVGSDDEPLIPVTTATMSVKEAARVLGSILQQADIEASMEKP